MKYFTIKELTNSTTAARRKLDNTPTEEVKKNLEALVDNILDPLREKWGRPILVNSGYRSSKVNSAVGGSKTSLHMTGQAADIRTQSNTKEENKKLFKMILDLKLPFDQLINEYDYSWVHVSFSPRNRRQILAIR